MLNRRLFALSALSLGLAAGAAAPAWSWGKSERVKGSGELASETRDHGAFDGISLEGGFKVLVRQGTRTQFEIKADKNLLGLIETRVVDGRKGRTLEISAKRGHELHSTSQPELILEVAQLRAIAIGGSGEVRVEAMKTAAVEAAVGGSGDIVFVDLSSDSLGVKVAGSGEVRASGRTGVLRLSIAGSGDVKARALAAEEVKVSIAGSGDAEVNAGKVLKVSIAGSGDVGYLGSPEVSSSVAGSGKVRRLQP